MSEPTEFLLIRTETSAIVAEVLSDLGGGRCLVRSRYCTVAPDDPDAKLPQGTEFVVNRSAHKRVHGRLTPPWFRRPRAPKSFLDYFREWLNKP